MVDEVQDLYLDGKKDEAGGEDPHGADRGAVADRPEGQDPRRPRARGASRSSPRCSSPATRTRCATAAELVLGLSAGRAHTFEAWEIELHGHRVIYRMAGSGPPVVLIHGMVNSSRHWEAVALQAGRPLHGHRARPDRPRRLGDAARRLLARRARRGASATCSPVIGIERATIVGHSLGGGVAMQFFYQFPQRTERLALVSSGGLGDEVEPDAARAPRCPACSRRCSVVAPPRGARTRCGERRRADARARQREGRVPAGDRPRAAAARARRRARAAFVQTLRSVIDVRGQRVQRPRPPLPARATSRR